MPTRPALGVHQRAAAVAGVDRGVGLEEVLVHVALGHPVLGADDALGHGLADAEGIAHGEHHVADGDFAAVGERQRGQVIRLDLDERDIRLRVGADEFGDQVPSVGQRDADLGGVLDDVIVCEDVAFRGNDHAGAEGLLLLLEAAGTLLAEVPALLPEEPSEHVHLVVGHFGMRGLGSDKHLDDARRDLLHDGGEAPGGSTRAVHGRVFDLHVRRGGGRTGRLVGRGDGEEAAACQQRGADHGRAELQAFGRK